MPAHGGFLSFGRAAAPLLLLLSSGCVRDAVLENRVRAAFERDAALAATADLTLAEAALAGQLLELEALARSGADTRALELLSRSYGLWAHGFIEVRKLEAIATGDGARAERERQDQADAEARSREYARLAGSTPANALAPYLGAAAAACHARDAMAYDRELHAVLARRPREPSDALRLAVAKRLAAAWLMPRVAERCQLTPVVPSAPPPASG